MRKHVGLFQNRWLTCAKHDLGILWCITQRGSATSIQSVFTLSSLGFIPNQSSLRRRFEGFPTFSIEKFLKPVRVRCIALHSEVGGSWNDSCAATTCVEVHGQACNRIKELVFVACEMGCTKSLLTVHGTLELPRHHRSVKQCSDSNSHKEKVGIQDRFSFGCATNKSTYGEKKNGSAKSYPEID